MPEIFDLPPQDIRDELARLTAALDASIPARQLDRNLLVATWNLRAFGDLTEKWVSEEADSPRRDLQSLLCIEEILSRFDVIAVQEVRGNLKCLRHMLKKLGPDWAFTMTDVTRGSQGNDERLAFLFDTRRVNLSGLACELVLPEELLKRVEPDALKTQFARTPYAVSFRSGEQTFILVTLHIKYGDQAAERVPELKAIADWLADWANEINQWGHNLIALGDFNIDRKNDALYQAFTSTGLTIADDLYNLPRTIFSKSGQPDLDHFYDQIAWFSKPNGKRPALSLKYERGGNFDFLKAGLTNRNLSKAQVSWMISDHYPLWVEFRTRD